jgi:hypothetical protein
VHKVYEIRQIFTYNAKVHEKLRTFCCWLLQAPTFLSLAWSIPVANRRSSPMGPPILQFTSNEKYTKMLEAWNPRSQVCGPIEGISTYTNNLSRWNGLKIVWSSQQLQSTQIVNWYFKIRFKIQKIYGVKYQADHWAARISLQIQPFPPLINSRFFNLKREVHLSKGPQ